LPILLAGRFGLLQTDPNVQVLWAIPFPDGRSAALGVITGENNVWIFDNLNSEDDETREKQLVRRLERCFPLTEAAL
jgi:hypothetical protein